MIPVRHLRNTALRRFHVPSTVSRWNLSQSYRTIFLPSTDTALKHPTSTIAPHSQLYFGNTRRGSRPMLFASSWRVAQAASPPIALIAPFPDETTLSTPQPGCVLVALMTFPDISYLTTTTNATNTTIIGKQRQKNPVATKQR